MVTALFRMIIAFKVFDEIFLLTGGSPGTSTEVVSFTIYRRFFTEGDAGHGAALSVLTMAAEAMLSRIPALLLLVIGQRHIVRGLTTGAMK